MRKLRLLHSDFKLNKFFSRYYYNATISTTSPLDYLDINFLYRNKDSTYAFLKRLYHNENSILFRLEEME